MATEESRTNNLRRGVVRQVSGREAIVATARRGACEKCSEKGICFAFGKDKPEEVTVHNGMDAKVGDIVDFAVRDGVVLKATGILFILPLATLATGALLGARLAGGDGWNAEDASVLGALAGFGVGIGIGILIDRLAKQGASFKPAVTKIVKGAKICSTHEEKKAGEPVLNE